MNKVIILSTIFVFLFGASCDFSAGSYPYAERYVIMINEDELIIKINNFKKDNIEYNLPDSVPLNDGRNESAHHWYHVYFYLQQEQEIVKAWVRGINNEKSYFAFVAINKGGLGNWKYINKDFSKKENKIKKNKFEDDILSNIVNLQ